MKKLLAITLLLATVTVAHAGILDSVKSFLGLGVSQSTSVKTGTVTNSTTVGDTVIGDTTTTIGSTTQTVNADVIKSFVGSQDANALFLPLQKANTETIDFQKKAVDELKNFTERLIKENNYFYETQAKLQREFTQALVDRALQQHVPIYSASSSIPFSLYQNALSTPLYIKDVDSITNTQSLVNSFNNMSSIPTSGGSGESTAKSITQTAHGFVVGDWVYLAGTVYTKTDADLAVSADSVGVVTAIPTVNTFTLTTEGYATGLTGLVAGSRYYLSTTAGAITATAPTSNIKAVFIADTTTSGYVQQYAVGASSQALTYASLSMSAPNASVPLIATTIGAGYFALDLDAATLNVRYDPTNSMKAADNSFTVPTTGLYEIIFNANITTSNGSISIYVNGSRVSGSLSIGAASNADAKGVVYIGSLTAGQRVEFAGDASAVLNASVTLKQLPTAVAPVVNTVAEYVVPQYAAANVTPTSGQSSSATAAQFMAVNIPSAGVWDIEWSVLGQVWQGNGGGTSDGIASGLYDIAGTFIANTELGSAPIAAAGSTTGSNLYVQGTRSTTLTTTGATTYNVKVWNPNGLTRATAGSGVNGRSYIKATKIAGQLPSTGTTVDYVNVYRTSNISVPGLSAVVFNAILSGNIPYNTSNGQFTLTAGKTYKLAGNVNVDSANGGLFTAWYNVTSGAYISPGGRSTSADSVTGTFGSNQAELIFTPTVNTIVELRNTLGAPGTAAGGVIGAVAPAGIASQATIVQLGSTDNTVGTLPAVDQSSAGYFDIGNMRMQWGRVASTLDDNETFTFPMPFSTTPSVQATIEVANGGNYPTGVGVPGTGIKSVTTTNFIFNRDDTIANTDNPFVNWHAFGQK